MLSVTWPPAARISSAACSRDNPGNVPVMTKVWPARGPAAAGTAAGSVTWTPSFSSRSISFRFRGSTKKPATACAMAGPMPRISPIWSAGALESARMEPKCRASNRAPCSPTCRIPSPKSSVERGRVLEASIAATSKLGVTVGLRAERRGADFVGSAPHRFAPDDDMIGGELAFDWSLAERRTAYLRLARGYKAGGFNVSLAGVDFNTVDGVEGLTADHIEFGPEYLTSVEAGVRSTSASGRLRADVGAFVARRDDQQIKVPLQLRLGDPSSFLFVTANAERGEHRGLEATVQWDATERLELSAAAGWLDATVEEFALFPGLAGREQAHAPAYTYSLGALYSTRSGWWVRLDVSGMDAFFYDYGHDQRSTPYNLANLSVGRDWDAWSVKLWARNVLDEEYFVRGFYFGNEPPDFAARLYTRLGDPRHYGVTLRYRF